MEDFAEDFEKMFICKTQPWNELRFRSRFLKPTLKGTEQDEVLSKHYYTLVVAKKSDIVIAIH
jgi:hypothetical protein